MARLAPLADLIEAPTPPVPDPLSHDRFAFEARLLRPVEISGTERLIQRCSAVAGPVALGSAYAVLIAWFF